MTIRTPDTEESFHSFLHDNSVAQETSQDLNTTAAAVNLNYLIPDVDYSFCKTVPHRRSTSTDTPQRGGTFWTICNKNHHHLISTYSHLFQPNA